MKHMSLAIEFILLANEFVLLVIVRTSSVTVIVCTATNINVKTRVMSLVRCKDLQTSQHDGDG